MDQRNLAILGIAGLLLFLFSDSRKDKSTLQQLISRESRTKGIPPVLTQAVVQVESGGNPRAFRQEENFATRGLMQVSPGAARDVGYTGSPESLFDPATNIKVGTAYLKKMFGWFNADPGRIDSRWERAVAAYNAGPGNISRYGIVNPEYVNKVKRNI